MGEVIAFPLDKNKKLQEELLFAQKLRCPECGKLKEDDWFIAYKDNTYLCVDCSYERGEK
jgi:DNA-directed RNA polymerase subunit RPC12/RpoP